MSNNPECDLSPEQREDLGKAAADHAAKLSKLQQLEQWPGRVRVTSEPMDPERAAALQIASAEAEIAKMIGKQILDRIAEEQVLAFTERANKGFGR